ncbi:response regulator [Methylopila jiangsuensis]|uniref:Response regulator n=1 Tax=Methylopila jiangsuensis TaxID=586230 RepID=A0A9W6N412_9HYPH|nr:response regulator [Methylopila jiangsuensis]MDR6287160.1 CheY-like chemotaxis protein [Methylopila jiangsuensis]GLK76647.1 response regulator [Methylopila jiangsuensis]
MSERDFSGLKILVVEDEAMISMMIEDMLLDHGVDVVGPAGGVAQAMKLLDAAALDGALLDVNLGGEKSFPVADALAAKGVPIVFTTGYGEAGVIGRYPDARTLQKPFVAADLIEALSYFQHRG